MKTLHAIIGTLPNTLTNGTTADASQVMADFNAIVTAVNSNAAPLANAVFTNVINTFTARQIGVLAAQAADFPIAMQVQGNMNYGSDAGTANAFAVHPTPAIAAYADGQPVDFFAANQNGGAATLAVSGLTARPIVDQLGNSLSSAQIPKGAAVRVLTDNANARFILPYIDPLAVKKTYFTQKGSLLVASGNAIAGSFSPGADGTFPMWLGSETLGVRAASFTAPLNVGGNAVSLGLNSAFLATSGTQVVANNGFLQFYAGADQVFNTTYVNSVTAPIGSTGTWLITCGAVITNNNTAAAQVTAKIWDSTITYASSISASLATSQVYNLSLQAVVKNPTIAVGLAVKSSSAAANSTINFNASGESKDVWIFATRIA